MKRRALVGVAAAAAAAGAGVAWWQRRDAADPAVQRLWARRFERPDGGELVMAEWRGRPLVVNFWATWCPPCIEELPALDRFHREQGNGGWRVVALAIDGAKAVRDFLDRVPLTMAIGLAGAGGTDLLGEFGNARGGLPYTVLIAAGGRIVWRKAGAVDIKELRGQTLRNPP